MNTVKAELHDHKEYLQLTSNLAGHRFPAFKQHLHLCNEQQNVLGHGLLRNHAVQFLENMLSSF